MLSTSDCICAKLGVAMNKNATFIRYDHVVTSPILLCFMRVPRYWFNIISILQRTARQADVLKTCLHSCFVRSIDLVDVTRLLDARMRTNA